MNYEEIEELKDAWTGCVRLWLNPDEHDPNTFLIQRYGIAEVRQEVASADNITHAAGRLKSWFVDRLTVDPGVPGPFGSLACDFLSTTLDLVDWEAIASEMRHP